jgi:preprotein translocase subunit SecD
LTYPWAQPSAHHTTPTSVRTVAFLSFAPFLLLSACGGSDPEITLLLQADMTGLTPGLSSAAFLDATSTTLRQRAQFYGLDVPEISAVGDLFTVKVKGVDEGTAGELFSRRGELEFKQPRLTVEGVVVCRTAAGEEFGVLPENLNPDDASRSPARCFSRDKVGDPVWDPAASGDVPLTAAGVVPDGWSLNEEPPSISVTFTPDGSALLKGITGQLVGYPLGIFLDGELIAAPRIQRTITEGQAAISGFGLARARIFAAILNSGPLALALTVSAPAPTP